MATQAAVLSPEDKLRLQESEINRRAAESGRHDLTFEEVAEHLRADLKLADELHERYDLDPEELYEFDAARGIIFKSFD